MNLATEHDVIIVGAGPAGASTAIRLAVIGLDVAIVERLQFPRPHVGICLSDQTLALLDYLDRLERTSEWPITAPLARRFLFFLLIPLFSWLGGALVERLVAAILD